MSDKIDALISEMRELTETVKDHADDKATLDMEKLEATFSEQIEAKVQAEVEKRLADKPVRRIPGEHIAAGQEAQNGVLQKNRYAPMVKDFGRQGYHQIGTVKARPVDLWLAHNLLQKGHSLMPDRVQLPSEDMRAALKALTSDGSGTGDELVPTNMAGSLWEDFFLASKVASLFDTIDMPTNPFDVPLGLGDVTWRKGSENTATSASDPATAKSTLTATELVTEVNWSYTLQEDSIVALMPAVRSRLAISGAEIIDDFMINADSTASSSNINTDGTPAADAYYLSAGQDGLRHVFLTDNTDMGSDAGGDALADADITGEMAAMGKYAASPERLAMICDVATYLNGFLKLTNAVTVDKFGPDAVVLTGQLAAYRGVPIVVSASMPKSQSDGTLSATAASNTLGNIAIVNRNMWYVGFRRNLLVEVDRDIQRRQYIMVVSLRQAVGAHGTRASITHTGGIYNILV